MTAPAFTPSEFGSAFTARDFKRQIAAHAASLRRKIETEATGLADQADAVAARVAAATDPVTGFETFCRTYFPHYVTGDNSRLHDHLYDRLPELVAAGESQFDAIAAPRGEAKSTLCAALFPLWCICRGSKHFILLVTDALHQAQLLLESIKAELEINARLRLDFPVIAGRGPSWTDTEIVTGNGVMVLALGSGKRLRGLRHGPHRPDLVVLDDLENDENVRSPEQRDRLEGWVDKAVLGVGGAGEKCDVLYIGTILHYDSVLARKLNHPLWRAVKFKAIERWPDRLDLWDRWEEVLRNQGQAAAAAFHAERRVELEQGARVSWSRRPLLALMQIRVRVGHRAFDAEFQNEPVNEEGAAFSRVTFWTERRRWVMFGACDPSLGLSRPGRDPSALLIGGRGDDGVLDVVEAQIRSRLPDRIIEDIIAMQAEYRCVRWAVETVQFQAFFAGELVKRSAARGIPVPVVPVKNTASKELRIETLHPHIANGVIRFNQAHTALLDQLRHWPSADHDDGPDALEMLWTISLAGQFEYRGGELIGAGVSARAAFGGDDEDDERGRFGAAGRLVRNLWRGW